MKKRGVPRLIRGFTLIEILVVVTVFVIIAILAANMFFSIFKGSSKTRVLAEVKQNGNYALGVMERMIRNARSIENYGGNYIKIRNPDDSTTTFRCGDSNITLDGASLISDKVKVKTCSGVFNVASGETGVKPDVVTINFTLVQAEGNRGEETAQASFKTSVTLRNY